MKLLAWLQSILRPAAALPPGSVLIDVREAAEYAAGHVAGAVNLPLSQLPQHLPQLRQAPALVLYCASGMRAERGCRLLRDAGCRQVINARTQRGARRLGLR